MKYLLTITKYQKLDFVDESELRLVMEYLKDNKVYFIDYAMETSGMYRQLHLHAVVKYRGRYKFLSKFGNFRVHWSPVTDINGAFRYIYKDAYNRDMQSQILVINQYSYEPKFI